MKIRQTVFTALVFLTVSSSPSFAGNINTTIQEGTYNTNRNVQYGQSNDNATYQQGADNYNTNRQYGQNNANQTGQFGGRNYNSSRQEER